MRFFFMLAVLVSSWEILFGSPQERVFEHHVYVISRDSSQIFAAVFPKFSNGAVKVDQIDKLSNRTVKVDQIDKLSNRTVKVNQVVKLYNGTAKVDQIVHGHPGFYQIEGKQFEVCLCWRNQKTPGFFSSEVEVSPSDYPSKAERGGTFVLLVSKQNITMAVHEKELKVFHWKKDDFAKFCEDKKVKEMQLLQALLFFEWEEEIKPTDNLGPGLDDPFN